MVGSAEEVEDVTGPVAAALAGCAVNVSATKAAAMPPIIRRVLICMPSPPIETSIIDQDCLVPNKPFVSINQFLTKSIELLQARIVRSSATAAALSSGSFPFPHLGDCTQLGQPRLQRQRSTTARVASK